LAGAAAPSNPLTPALAVTSRTPAMIRARRFEVLMLVTM
jgi:hypothetical protein